MDRFTNITLPNSSFASYRDAIRNTDPPLVPYVGNASFCFLHLKIQTGVYLGDLTFIGTQQMVISLTRVSEEGNPDLIDNVFIHFAKFRMVADVIHDIQNYQQKPYNLRRVEPIQQLLANLPTATDHELFDLSLVAEPRQ